MARPPTGRTGKGLPGTSESQGGRGPGRCVPPPPRSELACPAAQSRCREEHDVQRPCALAPTSPRRRPEDARAGCALSPAAPAWAAERVHVHVVGTAPSRSLQSSAPCRGPWRAKGSPPPGPDGGPPLVVLPTARQALRGQALGLGVPPVIVTGSQNLLPRQHWAPCTAALKVPAQVQRCQRGRWTEGQMRLETGREGRRRETQTDGGRDSETGTGTGTGRAGPWRGGRSELVPRTEPPFIPAQHVLGLQPPPRPPPMPTAPRAQLWPLGTYLPACPQALWHPCPTSPPQRRIGDFLPLWPLEMTWEGSGTVAGGPGHCPKAPGPRPQKGCLYSRA